MDFFLIIILGLIISSIYILIDRAKTYSLPDLPIAPSPQTTIITFDIHGVLFTPDWFKIAQLIWADKKLFILILYLFNPIFLYHVLKLLYKGAVLEKCITYLSDKHTYFARYKNSIVLIVNTVKPIPHMMTLIKELKKKGFSLHIFSNIGMHLYERLSEKFPQEFSLFDKACIPQGFHDKTHIETFLYYLSTFNPHHKQILFIDNNRKNIIMAKTVGIISIYYKNPKQLHKVLKKLRVL